ncbi:hypothetical protein SAMN05421762_0896 [Pseudooceanicola nitratireducens]|uniref:Uncharacterized protein n=1 Tax=Pseudooceanicola nitratireducens TaxID=517719 RepID=A0A1I1J4P0_9RHOB|nr:hypothetical protein [Pseudooceanicola nitratireducens]SEJ29222.1 hypothetical protein SAMN05216183_102896 [Pseudooceanicola nitratireducens]SFC43406.1 hypothetical protein SAMN05421762_0896 [Pseudooceanicola nitratireducens]
MTTDRTRMWLTLGALTIISVFVLANTHLLKVSLASQPACIAAETEGAATYRAAKPSC